MSDQRGTSAGPLRFVLPWLAFVSGFCGISYEILYAKLLGNLLGSPFTINATVLLTFLLGIGVGTLQAHRFARVLWLIEAGIGLYAGVMALGYPWIDRFLYARVPFLGSGLAPAAVVSFVLLAVPAFLIGCSVPLFSAYLGLVRRSHAFSWAYGVYNVGAALTAIGLEFVLLRSLGLASTTLLLASINLLVAAALLGLSRRAGLALPRPGPAVTFPRRVVLALALASVASAVFQLLMIKLAEFALGPYNETFALVLATVLLGLAVGSLAAARFRLGFAGALVLALAGLAWLLAMLPAVFGAYAALYERATQTYALLVLLKFATVAALMGIPAIGFGATIPALLRSYRDVARESGRLLFCSSVANAFGFLLMAFVLHRHLDYGPILLLVALITAGALLLHGARVPVLAGGLGLVAVAASALALSWNEMLLYEGHTNRHALMRPSHGAVELSEKFKGPQDVFAITVQDGKPYFFINGYISIPLSNASEKIVGALSTMLSPRLDEALVLGVGSGATAATVGMLFERTDAVEINRAVLDNLHRMRDYNFDIESIDRLAIHHDDGMHFIKSGDRRYSLIVNTVTTPLYFSSSKLYTRDFFELVKRRLAPDGVYTTWVDIEIGDRGIDIILETLAASFEHCWLHVIKSDYFLLGCSNAELRLDHLDHVAACRPLVEELTARHEIPVRLLPYNVLSTEALRLRSPAGAPLNTLDRPTLEHTMARLQTDRLHGFKSRVWERVDLRELQRALRPSVDWQPAEFAFNASLRVDGTATHRLLERMVGRDFDVPEEERDRVALELAREIGTADAFYRYGKRLFERERYDAAVEALGRAVALDGSSYHARYKLGRALAARGDDEPAFEQLRAAALLEPQRRAAIEAGKSLIELERFGDAVEWLEAALARLPFEDERSSGLGPVAERRCDILYHLGRAREGLGDPRRAEQDYRAALRAQPDSQRVRRALNRLRAARAETASRRSGANE